MPHIILLIIVSLAVVVQPAFGADESRVVAMQKEISTLKTDNKRLVEQNAATQKQLAELRSASENVTRLMDQNRELVEKNQLLQSKVASLEAVKEKFQDSRHMDQFIYGGLLVLATLIVSTLIDNLRRRRAYNSWN